MLRSNVDIAAFDGTGLVREPCKTCRGHRLVGSPPMQRGDGGYFDPADDERDPCPDCKDGLAPRVVEVDLTPRRECEACGKYGERMRGTVPLCVAEDRSDDPNHRGTHSCRMVPCPARCDAGWLGWEGEPPDLGPLLEPRCPECLDGNPVVPHSRHANELLLDSSCVPCQGRGYLDPLCDVIAVTVEKPKTIDDVKVRPLIERVKWEEQCAEVGVRFEIREVSRGA